MKYNYLFYYLFMDNMEHNKCRLKVGTIFFIGTQIIDMIEWDGMDCG